MNHTRRAIVAMTVVTLAWGCALTSGIKAGDLAPDFTSKISRASP